MGTSACSWKTAFNIVVLLLHAISQLLVLIHLLLALEILSQMVIVRFNNAAAHLLIFILIEHSHAPLFAALPSKPKFTAALLILWANHTHAYVVDLVALLVETSLLVCLHLVPLRVTSNHQVLSMVWGRLLRLMKRHSVLQLQYLVIISKIWNRVERPSLLRELWKMCLTLWLMWISWYHRFLQTVLFILLIIIIHEFIEIILLWTWFWKVIGCEGCSSIFFIAVSWGFWWIYSFHYLVEAWEWFLICWTLRSSCCLPFKGRNWPFWCWLWLDWVWLRLSWDWRCFFLFHFQFFDLRFWCILLRLFQSFEVYDIWICKLFGKVSVYISLMQAMNHVSRRPSFFDIIGQLLFCSWLGNPCYLFHELPLVILLVLSCFLVLCFFLLVGILWFRSFELLLLIFNIRLWLGNYWLLWFWLLYRWWCWGRAQLLKLFLSLLFFCLSCCLRFPTLSQQSNLLFNMCSSSCITHSFRRCIKSFSWNLNWPTMTHKLWQIFLILTLGRIIEPDLAELGMIPVFMYSIEWLQLPQLYRNQIQFIQLWLLFKQCSVLATKLLLDFHVKSKCLQRCEQALLNFQLWLFLEIRQLRIWVWDALHF